VKGEPDCVQVVDAMIDKGFAPRKANEDVMLAGEE